MKKIYRITDKHGNVFEYDNLKEGCEELNLTSRLLRYTEEKWKNTNKRYQEHHKGHKLEVIDEDTNTSKGLKTAVIVGDLHFPYQNKDAVDILFQIVEDYKNVIDEYIDAGDGINANSLSSFVNYEEDKYTLKEEIDMFSEHMYKIKDIIPNAKFVNTEGNHYYLRLERFFCENPGLRDIFKTIEFPFDEVKSHGQLYFPFQQERIGVLHGFRSNKYVAAHTLKSFQCDTINLHAHTFQSFTARNGQTEIGMNPSKGFSIGSMCRPMKYLKGKSSRQANGFAFLTYDEKSDNYSLENIYIEGGTSIFRGKKYESRLI